MSVLRLRPSTVALGLSLALGACATPQAKPDPSPTSTPPPPPPPPVGDLLRLSEGKGDSVSGNVKLLIEQRAPNKKGKLQQVQLNFDFATQEKIEGVEADAALVTARLRDASGSATGAKQESVDAFSVALDEMKVTFRRNNRADVTALTITDVKKPLDEQTAKNVISNVFGALRGPVLPEGRIEAGATWSTTSPLPPMGNFSGQVTSTFTYAKKEGAIAVVTGEGTIDGNAGAAAQQQKLVGKVTSELRIDLGTGKVVYSLIDNDQKVQKPTGESLYEQHFKSEWTVK